MKKNNAEIPEVEFSKAPVDGFEIMSLETLYERIEKANDHDPYAPHRVNFFLIMIVSSGSGRHFIDFKNHSYESGSILMVAKNQVHGFAGQKNIKGYLVVFTEKFLHDHLVVSRHLSPGYIFNYPQRNPVINRSEIKNDEFIRLAEMMSREYHTTDEYAKAESLRHLLHLFLLKSESIYLEEIASVVNPTHLKLFEKFNNFLANKYAKSRNVKDYSAFLKITYQHLNTICKEIRGITAKEYVDEFVTMEIRRYLAGTELSNKEICFRTGFDEPGNMNKFFKKNSGFTLNEFKNIYTHTNV